MVDFFLLLFFVLNEAQLEEGRKGVISISFSIKICSFRRYYVTCVYNHKDIILIESRLLSEKVKEQKLCKKSSIKGA